jgi:two-component system chemotaxis response regulator CheB
LPGALDAAERRGPAILVVDDSAVVRQALTAILSQAGMRVAAAADPVIAMEKLRRERPDAIVLDIEMPRMDGLTFLRRLMAGDAPIPVLVCSGHVGPGTEVALQAMEEGAVGIVAKPRLGVKGFLAESAVRLVEAVREAAAAQVRGRRRAAPAATAPTARARAIGPARRPAEARRIVAIGASTGGTEALREILVAMPPDAPPIAIVQHMPEVFTAAFARRLALDSRIDVREGRDGDRLMAGRALVAPGNHHLELHRGSEGWSVVVRDGPLVSGHRPSVDVLFRSVRQAAGAEAVGVILTGMGNDGAKGLRELRDAGGYTIAQDEASCVVYGMPGSAVAAGGVCEILPLGEIAAAVLARAG